MAGLLTFLASQWLGILMLLVLLIAFGCFANWLLWMFGWGRYSRPASSDSKIRFVVADFFVKIINDFRHLLALVIVILFAVALFTAMWPGMMKQDVKLIGEGLQGVAAALSGLLGSVIGYYFGESAAGKRVNATPPPAPPRPAEQEPPSDGTAGIKAPPIEAPRKPPLP